MPNRKKDGKTTTTATATKNRMKNNYKLENAIP